ncbi:alpha-galactosidase [Paenibacillus sp. HJGM_3]|uniref:alpha-galactosidase n=1 Tax=Paenibacillus sp. HJGM_3 TaxID=3379816 RepID=UPI00385F4798
MKKRNAAGKQQLNDADHQVTVPAQNNPQSNHWRDGFSQETYEQLVLENAAAIQQKLGGFGIRNIWTSIGNLGEMLPGNWLEENREAFPHGWSWLVDKLAGYGQRLGFWIAPFWIPNKLSNLFEEHRDNLLKQDGAYVFFDYRSPYGKSGTLPKEERVGFYSLDASHPNTLRFLRHVFEQYNRIGIRYFMIDFLFAGSGSTPGQFPYNGYHDRTMIKGPEVYRAALKTIREAAGEDTYLLSSTGTTFQNVGCVDAVRVGPDIGEGRPLIETMAEYPATYTIHGWPLISTVAASMAMTYFTDRKLYYNDGFNVLSVDKPIPLDEARATVSMFGLSSGPIMLGDDIATISPERLALVKKCLPPYERMARPVDLFTAVAPDTPKVFNLRVEKEWDCWNVVGVLNAGASVLSVDLHLGDLGLEADQAYCLFDFWNEMYLGEASATLHVEVPAYSVRVLRISRARPHPWLLATDMHVTQGGVELPRLRWDERRLTLQGVCTRPVGETGTLYFRLPPGWKPVRYEGLHAAKLRADNLVIVSKTLEFPVETVSWRIDFERYGEHAAGNYAGLEVRE